METKKDIETEEIFDGKKTIVLTKKIVRKIEEELYVRNKDIFEKLDRAAAGSRIASRNKIVF